MKFRISFALTRADLAQQIDVRILHHSKVQRIRLRSVIICEAHADWQDEQIQSINESLESLARVNADLVVKSARTVIDLYSAIDDVRKVPVLNLSVRESCSEKG
ncbi:hypothetical protein FF011L_34320 [Roseimaritima multifibrata]|uniref:Uncharacterized protein n=1 Tax=Roseimaritima multifibrata TaxID=1930274 RepID=A0A517MIE0_9BACT|nr:hypothetical protein FF011L_34320 [Roseimaritima multifibrata]